MNNDKQVNALNNLVARCCDAEEGFKDAAENVVNPKLKTMFREFSQQRNKFGNEIKGHIRSIGGEVDNGTSVAADLHRVWMDVKTALSTNDEASILNEVKRGEEYALESYNDALEEMAAGSPAYNTVVNQRNQIRSVIQRVEQLIPVFNS